MLENAIYVVRVDGSSDLQVQDSYIMHIKVGRYIHVSIYCLCYGHLHNTVTSITDSCLGPEGTMYQNLLQSLLCNTGSSQDAKFRTIPTMYLLIIESYLAPEDAKIHTCGPLDKNRQKCKLTLL